MAISVSSKLFVDPVRSSSLDSLPLDGFSRWDDFRRLLPFGRETLRLREIAGKFPRRVYFSVRCAAWPNRELRRWLADPANYRAEN